LNPQATAVTPAKKYTPRKRAGASWSLSWSDGTSVGSGCLTSA
jgi:hypothetical protein